MACWWWRTRMPLSRPCLMAERRTWRLKFKLELFDRMYFSIAACDEPFCSHTIATRGHMV